MSWIAQVQTAGDGDSWSGNSLVFATEQEADSYAKDLMNRWFSVTATRSIESDKPVSHAWTQEGLQDA